MLVFFGLSLFTPWPLFSNWFFALAVATHFTYWLKQINRTLQESAR